MPLDGVDAQALEHGLTQVEEELRVANLQLREMTARRDELIQALARVTACFPDVAAKILGRFHGPRQEVSEKKE